ncbi:von Willebrand factor type A domain protein [Gardnerella vaginalis]|uniref:von Willebrand factor type A domain protein n=1 Tax=Gardnerella vaginalis TaxID=2702 RepID=A0A135ZB40_GARVA|nr:von Willebrand factor type A domain protein [Gardnerella vaginalis]
MKIVSVICTILIITVPAGLISYYNWVNRFQMPYGKLRSAITQNVADNYKIRIVGSDVRDYPHVKLYFSVTDNTGESLEIESPTAAIKEKVGKGSDIERRIRNIERIKDKQGVGYEIMLDKSYSMYNSMDIMKNTMKDFVRALNYKVGDKAEVISFDTYLMYMASYTKDEDNLLNGIDNMEPYGNTALYDALYTGVTNASKRIGANCVIAFTDGEDNMSQHSMDDVISFAKDKGIPIYLIGTADANTTYLQTIAEQTGGYFWNLKFIKDMSEVLDRIKANQDNVYCLEYDSDSSADPYADRVISALLADSKHSYSGGIGDDLPFNPIRGEKVQKASYTVHKGDVTWTEANAACMQDGAHLATIPTKDEEDKLIQLAEENDIKYVWIGGYTSERPNGDVFAHWITGEKTTYTNWMQGEPSRNDRDGSPEFYLMLWKVGDQWSWNDERDNLYNSSYLHDTFSGKTGYICKVDSKN